MPKTVIIEESTIINAPLDAVWTVSGSDFEHIDRWDGNVKTSSMMQKSSTDTFPTGRVCNMYNGRQTVEEMVTYNKQDKILTYQISKGLPGFVRSAHNTWTHSSRGEGQTEIKMQVKMEVQGILGTLMQAPMRSQMGKVPRKAQEELKYFIENGTPHPRKQKAIEKAK